jgi:hypothetical protein
VAAQPSNAAKRAEVTADDRRHYINAKIRKANEYPHTFLNIPKTVRLVGAKVLKEERALFLRILALAGAILALSGLVFGYWQNLPSFMPKQKEPAAKTAPALVVDIGQQLRVQEAAIKDLRDKDEELMGVVSKTKEQLEATSRIIQEQNKLIDGLRKRVDDLNAEMKKTNKMK